MPGSIRNSLRSARENARVVRDRISKEMWEAMNELWLAASEPPQDATHSGTGGALLLPGAREVGRFHGVTLNSMMRGEAFSFYTLGTFLERTDMTARIMDVKYHLLLPELSMVGSPLDYYQWVALLKSLSGFEAFRRRYQTGLRPLDIAGFIIFDADFPRSLRFRVDRLSGAAAKNRQPGPESVSDGALQGLADISPATRPRQCSLKDCMSSWRRSWKGCWPCTRRSRRSTSRPTWRKPAVRYLIEHRMEVTFAEGPVREHHCELRMVPRDDGQQRLLGSTVNMQPENEMWSWQDAFGNRVHCFGLLPHHEHVTIEPRARCRRSTASRPRAPR